MNTRSLLAFSSGIVVLAMSSADGGLVARESTPGKPTPPSSTPSKQPAPPVEKSASTGGAKSAKPNVEDDKALLGRLVKELQRSSRSFLYLRSVGFTQTDEEFEKIIARNNAIFERTRIVRYDEQGNRQIPGWPGVRLTVEYKAQKH